MQVVFRVDASLEIGTGHVMRCLTLADALALQGARCSFICRAHEGNLCDFIVQRGFRVHQLPVASVGLSSFNAAAMNTSRYANWLGGAWHDDAQQICAIVGEDRADWIVVDHYAIDYRWEQRVRSCCGRLMVIDDLTDRRHDCDLLLDQNLGRAADDYREFLPGGTPALLGPRFALLRPEFAAWREYSLARRSKPQFKNLLITMGGVDQGNLTGQILETLKGCLLPSDLTITVVLGLHAPWFESVVEQAAGMPRPTQVLAGAGNMAQLMSESDLAIGAAGATSWERCCLGLPSIMFVLADNQRYVARALKEAGAAELIIPGLDFRAQFVVLFSTFLSDLAKVSRMGECAARIADGTGAQVVLSRMGALR